MFHVKHPLSSTDFKHLTGATDDTANRLSIYLEVLEQWNRRINLVSADSMTDPWCRHFFDSAQVVAMLPAGSPVVVDLGSGAGFPGLVLAVMSSARVHLVESNTRKCAFLREAARLTRTSIAIHNKRIESFPAANADVVTARACAPLTRLLNFAAPLLSDTGFSIFLKGKSAEAELTQARKAWKMQVSTIPSRTDPHGVILKISDIGPRHEP